MLIGRCRKDENRNALTSISHACLAFLGLRDRRRFSYVFLIVLFTRFILLFYYFLNVCRLAEFKNKTYLLT